MGQKLEAVSHAGLINSFTAGLFEAKRDPPRNTLRKIKFKAKIAALKLNLNATSHHKKKRRKKKSLKIRKQGVTRQVMKAISGVRQNTN